MVEHAGGKLFPTEIKSSATFTPDFCKNLHKFTERYPDKREQPSVVYCGKEAFSFRGVAFTPFGSLGQDHGTPAAKCKKRIAENRWCFHPPEA